MSERRVILINTCSTAARAYSNAHFGQGSVATIWLDDVRCSGLEAQLLDCPAQPLGTHNCGHNEDAGVSCGTSQGTTNCTYSLGYSPSITFRHLTANSDKMGHTAEGTLFISAQLSTDAVRPPPPYPRRPPPPTPKRKERKRKREEKKKEKRVGY